MKARKEEHVRASHEPKIVRTSTDDAVIVNSTECNAQQGELRHDENEDLKYDKLPS